MRDEDLITTAEMPVPAERPQMRLTREQIDIMRHTRDRAAGGYYCGDSPAMQALVAEEFMEYAGRKSFVPDPYFSLTSKGREALRAALTEPTEATK